MTLTRLLRAGQHKLSTDSLLFWTLIVNMFRGKSQREENSKSHRLLAAGVAEKLCKTAASPRGDVTHCFINARED